MSMGDSEAKVAAWMIVAVCFAAFATFSAIILAIASLCFSKGIDAKEGAECGRPGNMRNRREGNSPDASTRRIGVKKTSMRIGFDGKRIP